MPYYVVGRLQTVAEGRLAAGPEKALAGGVARLLRRAAALHHRGVLGQPRAPGLKPRGRGAGRGVALCLRHARRQDRLGRRTPDLCPQDHHRAPRGVPYETAAGRHQRLPAHGRERIRRLRRRPRLGFDLRGLRHGQGGRAAGREAAGRGRDRRRLDDRRPTTTTWPSTRPPVR